MIRDETWLRGCETALVRLCTVSGVLGFHERSALNPLGGHGNPRSSGSNRGVRRKAHDPAADRAAWSRLGGARRRQMRASEVGASYAVKAPTADENRRRGSASARGCLGVKAPDGLLAGAGEQPNQDCSLSRWMRHDVFCRSWGERRATPTVSGPASANCVGPEMALKPYDDA